MAKKLTKTYMATAMLNANYFPAIYEFGGPWVLKYIRTNSEQAYARAKERALNSMVWHSAGSNKVERLYERFLAGINEIMD